MIKSSKKLQINRKFDAIQEVKLNVEIYPPKKLNHMGVASAVNSAILQKLIVFSKYIDKVKFPLKATLLIALYITTRGSSAIIANESKPHTQSKFSRSSIYSNRLDDKR